MCTCTSSQLRLGARRARRSCHIPLPPSQQPTRCSAGGRELPPSGVELATPDAASARRPPRARATSPAPARRPTIPMMPSLCRYRFQPAADEVPDGAGASSPSRRSSRRAGERSKRPGSDWPSMMVLCSCRSSRDAVAEEKRKASQLAKRLGWALPHASRAGTRSGRSALAMMERGEQRASDGRPGAVVPKHGRAKVCTGGKAGRREVRARSGR